MYDDLLVQQANRKFISNAMKQPLLSLKEEQEATVKWKKTKDLKSLHLLISSYEKLIISTAIKFRKYGLPFGDLVQEGNIGILKAAYKFDPEIKVRFSTYAIWWIKSSIQEFILRNWSIVRIGSTSTQKLLFFQFSKIQNKINNLSNGSDAIKEELAKKLKINTFDIDKLSESPFKKDYQIDKSCTMHTSNTEETILGALTINMTTFIDQAKGKVLVLGYASNKPELHIGSEDIQQAQYFTMSDS